MVRDSVGRNMYQQLLGSGAGNSSWLCSNGPGSGLSGTDRTLSPADNDGSTGNSMNRSRTSKSRWRRKTRESAAKSKTGLWGPTHSFSSNEEVDEDDDEDSDEGCRTSNDLVTPPPRKTPVANNSQGTDSTKSSQDSSPQNSHLNSGNNNKKSNFGGFSRHEPVEAMQHTLGRIWNNLQCLEDNTLKETFIKHTNKWSCGEEKKEEEYQPRGHQLHQQLEEEQPPGVTLNESGIMDYIDEFCSPCRPKNLHDETPLGIQRLEPPNGFVVQPTRTKDTDDTSNTNRDATRATSNSKGTSGPTPMGDGNARHQRDGSKGKDAMSVITTQTAADRRRQRHTLRQKNAQSGGAGADESSSMLETFEVTDGKKVVLVRKEPEVNKEMNNNNHATTTMNAGESSPPPLPMDQLELNKQKAVELERSISELTMRSSYGEATAKIAENRRMAYYAVGRHHRQSGRGGNRRCYFTGKLILGGAPFYAGSVQQGLRTLVVFCLPSALGLPREMQRGNSPSVRTPLISRRPSLAASRDNGSIANSLGYGGANKSTSSLLSRKSSRLSRLSSVDDTSMSVEEELDPNWALDREYLLRVLPEPSQALLDEMALRYPAQFETLPVQVRSPHCWKLYVKFCFFSGLPIAEGEMHYKVRDDIADQYGDEVILSHEVMEAVNGDSAEILRLPNLKTFRYLRKHYQQQSAKLPDSCFQRQAWEMVRPEV